MYFSIIPSFSKHYIIITFVLAFIFINFLLFYSFLPQSGRQAGERCFALSLERGTVFLGDHEIQVEIADTPEARHCGLSFRDELSADHGMFFVFEAPGRHGIWMKNMLFPIDIIWLDEGLSLVATEQNVSPDSYPRAFAPRDEASYVLEVNAGTAEELDISVGERAYLNTQ